MKISSETQRSIIPAEDKLKFFVNYTYEKVIIILKNHIKSSSNISLNFNS